MVSRTRDMNIDFSEVFTQTADRSAVSFWVELDGKRITCHVSYDLLVREFGAKNRTRKETTLSFRENFAQICDMARQRIAADHGKETELRF